MRIGDSVFYFPGAYDRTVMGLLDTSDKLAAVVAHVHPDGLVNVAVYDSFVTPHIRTRVGVGAPGIPSEGHIEAIT